MIVRTGIGYYELDDWTCSVDELGHVRGRGRVAALAPPPYLEALDICSHKVSLSAPSLQKLHDGGKIQGNIACIFSQISTKGTTERCKPVTDAVTACSHEVCERAVSYSRLCMRQRPLLERARLGDGH